MAAKKNPKSPSNPGNRPWAESPAEPAHRVQLCTAQAEWLRTLHPDQPQPVFSTMALAHGQKAPGAERLRPGFALTESMDLAWALGFPKMAFIVDGVPVPDTTDALFDLYQVKGRGCYNWLQAQANLDRVYPRRAAVARMYELDPYPDDATEEERADMAASILELPEEDLDEFTTYKPYSEEEIARCFWLSAQQQQLSDDVLLFEALCGPDLVLRVAVDHLESDGTAFYEVLMATRPLLLRATAETGTAFRQEVEKLAAVQGQAAEDAARKWFDVDTTVREHAKAGQVYGQYFPFVSSELRDLVTQGTLEEPVPHLDHALTGDVDPMLEALVKNLSKFEQLDTDRSFLRTLSSLRHPAILPALLQIGTHASSRAEVQAWFAVHGPTFLQDLRELASGKGKVAKLAKEFLPT